MNIQSLLHNVNDAIPTSFTNPTPPTVIFTRTPSIGSKIFNYKKVVQDLQANEWCDSNHTCDCSNSPFTDPNHGHVVTGNLNVVNNHKLRGLLSKGPSYREANKIDWGKVFLCIKRGVVDCAKSWCQNQNMDVCVLTEWKSRLLMAVRSKIRVLKKHHRRQSNKILDDDVVKTFLTDFHQKFVITPTDKAGNNFSIVCKKFYILCLLKELGISNTEKKGGNKTYTCMERKSELDVVKKHIKYMDRHGITLISTQKSLPFLYWIPKMHKNPSKQRYIAASHSCSTKPLSKMITYCLKLIQQTHTNYCNRIAKTRGFNRMWIVDNSVEVLKKISECNRKHVRNVRTYDFSTLYTSIPHKKLKERMAMVINQCFNGSGRRYIHIGRTTATWNRAKGNNNHSWNANDLISHVNYLIDNIYVVCGNTLFRQVIGIPMGTDCAPFLANLFLYSYECEWICRKSEIKEFDILNKFKNCFRYIDDLLCINNDQMMDDVMTEIYPPELSLTSDEAIVQANYLDLSIEIKNGKIHTSLFDKRDTFGFTIVNFPDLSGNIPQKQSYGVFVSQLIRYARCCQDLEDFRERTRKLVDRLVSQNFSLYRLARTFEKFAESHYELLYKYGVHVCPVCL